METIQIIQKAFRDDAMRAAPIKVWHKHFKDGRESVESDPHPGRPATSRTPETIEHVQAAINKGWRLTVQELEADLGDSKNYGVRDFDKDLGMKHVRAKFVPQLLLPEQKEHRAAVAHDLIQTANNAPDFLRKFITGRESCLYGYEPKARSSHGSLLVLHTQRWRSKVAAISRPC